MSLGIDIPSSIERINAGKINKGEKAGMARADVASILLILDNPDKPDRDDLTLQTAQERSRNEVS